MTDWRETTLGETLEIRHGYALRGEYFRDEGELIVLTPGNFYEEGGFKRKGGKEKYYDGPFPPQYLLAAGDVVVAMTEQADGLLGSTATIPTSNRYLHNQRLGLLRVARPETLDLRFCYHLLNASFVRQQIQATATGSKVRHTAPERIRAVRILLPDIATQRVTAAVLDTLDDLIKNSRRRIELLEQMAQEIYREWFVRFRYPGHERANLIDSPLGTIPEGWTVTTVGAVAGINLEARKPSRDESIRYLDISCLGDRRLDSPSRIVGTQTPGRARRVLRDGDVVWSMVRPGRRGHALLVEPGKDWIGSTGLAVLSARAISSTLLFEAVSTPEFAKYLVAQEGGSAYPAVKPWAFRAAPFLRPTRELDRTFETAIRPVHRLVWDLWNASSRLAAMRDLLLPKLVSGQIDVSKLDMDAVVGRVA